MPEYFDEEIWFVICDCQRLSESFMRKYRENLDWERISERQILSENFIREFSDELDWSLIFEHQKLSESFILEFKHKDNNYIPCDSQKLSEKFMRDHQDSVNWQVIAKYQKLSESFIKEFQDKLDWNHIFENQVLSESFIREFHEKIGWKNIYKCQKLSEEFIKEFVHNFDSDISYYMKLNDPDLKHLINTENNWLYLQDECKEELVKKHYEIIEFNEQKYVKCYKCVNYDYTSLIAKFLFIYDKTDVVYETTCFYNNTRYDGHGFHCLTKRDCVDFAAHDQVYNYYKIIEVIVPLDSCCMSESHGYPTKSHEYPEIRSSKMMVTNLDVNID